MTLKLLAKPAVTVAAFAVFVLVAALLSSPHVRANDDERDADESKIRQGFEIAPVTLHLDGKDRDLVGLGSYIVNAQADCNGCHSLFPPPPNGVPTEFTPPGNPYLLKPPLGPFTGKIRVNPATYLGGGDDFGPLGGGPNIVSRNLTPDKTGRPEGGHTFSEFRQIIRTGVDMDHLHPNCSATITTNCLPPPFNGAVLQIMPWPIYRNMSDHDLRAIYEYLSAVPCIDTVVAGQPQLRNACH
jgi:hypothetical protein